MDNNNFKNFPSVPSLKFDYSSIMSQMPQIDYKAIREGKEFDSGFAHILAEQIYNQIDSFDKSINPDEEVGIKLVQYGEIIKFAISEVGYEDPYLIYFYGFLDDGSPIHLIQHVSQISFVLIKMKRPEPEKPKRQIGFCSE